MCLAVPMRITELRGASGVAELDGARHVVDLSLLDTPRVGDCVIVHAGYAIERLDEDEADARLRLFDALAANQADAAAEAGG
jgi:hydrogenase expression/formation protein HypC